MKIKYVPRTLYSTRVEQLKPGDVFFLENRPRLYIMPLESGRGARVFNLLENTVCVLHNEVIVFPTKASLHIEH